MNLSLTRKTLVKVAMVVATPLLVVLVVANSAMGQSSAQQDQYGGKATLTFKVDTEGQVPEDATFFGFYSIVDAYNPLQLSDPDGDGTYTGSVELEKGKEYGVKIEKGSGTTEDYSALAGRKLTVPGEPTSVIQGPQTITLDGDRVVSATYDFSGEDEGQSPDNPGNGGQSPDNPGNGNDQYGNGDDQYGNGGDQYGNGGNQYGNGGNQYGNGGGQYGNGGNQRGNVSGGGGGATAGGGGPSLLPDTGGGALLPAVGIGVLLIGGGILARRILW